LVEVHWSRLYRRVVNIYMGNMAQAHTSVSLFFSLVSIISEALWLLLRLRSITIVLISDYVLFYLMKRT